MENTIIVPNSTTRGVVVQKVSPEKGVSRNHGKPLDPPLDINPLNICVVLFDLSLYDSHRKLCYLSASREHHLDWINLLTAGESHREHWHKFFVEFPVPIIPPLQPLSTNCK